MNDLGQRIKQARADQGLTQAQLAEELHVTRQTISNWENGRSVPDYVMLGQLARVLQLDTGIPVLEEPPEEAVSVPEEPAPPEPTQPEKSLSRRAWMIPAIAVLMLCVCVAMAVHWRSSPARSVYTMEWFAQEQKAEEGMAFVRTYCLESPAKARRNRLEATPVYQFAVFMKEENGVGCTIQDITLVYFSGRKIILIDSLAQEDFVDINLGSSYIGANQYRRMGINMPAGKESGIGFWISGTDDNGNAFESRYYLPLENE